MVDFQKQTTRLLSHAKSGRIGTKVFRALFPVIAEQLSRDAGSGWLSFWGSSSNIDELEHKKIVDPKILTTLGRIANYPVRKGRSYHAGLIHTYGYLFSQLATRHGYKRERWTSGLIARGLGLDSALIGPAPPRGTLLANTTLLLSGLQFGKSSRDRNWLRHFDQAPQEILDLIDDARPFLKVLEKPKPQAISGKHICFRTQLFAFTKRVNSCDALLVYSVLTGKSHNLITCFPVNGSFTDSLIEDAKTNRLVRPRYNAMVDLVPVVGVPGTKRLED